MAYTFTQPEKAECLLCYRSITKCSCIHDNIFRRDEYTCPDCGAYSMGVVGSVTEDIKITQALYCFLLNEKSPSIDIVVLTKLDSIIGVEEDRNVQYISEKDILKYYPTDFASQVDMALLNLSKIYSEYDCKIGLIRAGSHADIFENLPYALRAKNLTFIDCEITKDDFKSIDKIIVFFDLLVEFGYLAQIETKQFANRLFRISSKGWLRIQQLQKSLATSKKAFVAMWFDPKMESVWDAIRTAIEECGYVPERIDKKEHNNQIVPEILYEIKQSKFIVADLTGNRNGVYYEAGYAQALNKEVIVTWKKTKVAEEQPHFDIAQKNMIRWETEEELYNYLVKRIKATIA